MALSVAVRTFNWTTAQTASTTIDVNFGFTPKALIGFCSTSQTADGISSAIARGAARACFAADHTAAAGSAMSANRRCMVYETFDAAASADLRSQSINSGFLILSGSTGRLDIDAEANWPASSVRFIVDVQMSVGIDAHVTVIALGGTDVADATTGVLTEPGATGAQSVTGLTMTPSLVLFASIGNTTENSGVSGTGSFMLGASDGTRSWVYATGGDDNAATMNTVSYMKSSQVIALMPQPNASTIDAEATLTGMSAGQFDLNWSSRASTRKVFYLAVQLSTSTVHVDNLLTQTNTSNFSVTGYGHQPAGAVFVSAGRAASTASTPTDHSQLSWGMAESSTTREAQAIWDEDAAANADVAVALETDELYINIDSTNAVVGLMDLVSFDSDGMTLVMDDADPAQAFVGVISFGTPTAGTKAPPPYATFSRPHIYSRRRVA